MATLFQCPECYAVHERPLEAGFTLAMRCDDCVL